MSNSKTAHVVVVAVEMIIPHALSLKSKRQVVKSITDKIRSKFNASVAEIDYLDKWQRCVMGFCMINNNRTQLEKRTTAIAQLLQSNSDIQIVNFTLDWV